jgi:hypothetical protein
MTTATEKRARRTSPVKKKTIPGVFIIESLTVNDEKKGRYEGRILRDILTLSGKKTEYWYVRTWKELEEVVFDRFWQSGLRYLHISCHGDKRNLFLTLDNVSFATFGKEISNYLEERRLFISACEAVNGSLASQLTQADHYSLIGPDKSIRFDDAVVMWATFYHLALRNRSSMNAMHIRKVLEKMQTMFGMTFKYL